MTFDRAVGEGAVGVGVGEAGGQKVVVAEPVEDHPGYEQFPIGGAVEAQPWEGFRRACRDQATACDSAVGAPLVKRAALMNCLPAQRKRFMAILPNRSPYWRLLLAWVLPDPESAEKRPNPVTLALKR